MSQKPSNAPAVHALPVVVLVTIAAVFGFLYVTMPASVGGMR